MQFQNKQWKHYYNMKRIWSLQTPTRCTGESSSWTAINGTLTSPQSFYKFILLVLQHTNKWQHYYQSIKTNIQTYPYDFYNKTNQIHNIANLFYFGTTFHMFRTVSPSIIRSLRLYIQHQVYVIQVLWLLASKQPQNLYDICLMLYVQC